MRLLYTLLITLALSLSLLRASYAVSSDSDVLLSARKLEYGNSATLRKLAAEYQWQKSTSGAGNSLYLVLPKSKPGLRALQRLKSKTRSLLEVTKDAESKYWWYYVMLSPAEARNFKENSEIAGIRAVSQFGKIASSLLESSGSVKKSIRTATVGNETVTQVSLDFDSVFVSMLEENWEQASSLGSKWIAELGKPETVAVIQANLIWNDLQSDDSDVETVIDQQRREWSSRIDQFPDVVSEVKFDSLTIEESGSGVAIGNFKKALSSLSIDTQNAALMYSLLYLSLQPEVRYLSPVPAVRLLGQTAEWVTQSGSQGSTPIFSQGLKGSGQVIAISDTGLDQYSCFFSDSNGPVKVSSYQDPYTDNSKRKVIQYVAFADSTDESGGHGTHVSGTAVGNSQSSNTDVNGLAPDAKIAFFDVGSGGSSLQVPTDLAGVLLPPGYDAGARVHSISWGSTSTAYTELDASLDFFVYNRRDMVIAVAAGNCGEASSDCSSSGLGSIGSPANAKNIITVGASLNYPRSTSNVAFFSSRGPTLDQRIKPDLLAPGYSVTSASASGTTSSTCATETLAGTSMATPAIAASAALVREYFVDGFYPTGKANSTNSHNPSAALVKAVLINGAVDMSALQNSDGSTSSLGGAPDYIQGFGLVRLSNSLGFVGTTFNLVCLDDVSLTSGSTYSFNLTITSASTPVKITMTYTDPPAVVGSISDLVNDLDMTAYSVTKQTTYYPNGLNIADKNNNVEKIVIPSSSLSTGEVIVVTIKAASLSSSYASQSFALAATGLFNSSVNSTLSYNAASFASVMLNQYLIAAMLALLSICILQ